MNEAQLRIRIEELEEENRQLREEIVPAIALPAPWGINGHAAKMLSTIRAASPNLVSRSRMLFVLYGFDPPEWDGVDVYLTRLRRRLAETGVPVVIENRRGIGWRMSPESARAFDEAVSQREAV